MPSVQWAIASQAAKATSSGVTGQVIPQWNGHHGKVMQAKPVLYAWLAQSKWLYHVHYHYQVQIKLPCISFFWNNIQICTVNYMNHFLFCVNNQAKEKMLMFNIFFPLRCAHSLQNHSECCCSFDQRDIILQSLTDKTEVPMETKHYLII